MMSIQSILSDLRMNALGLIMYFCCAIAGLADVIYVDAGATGGNTGASWSDAYADLQDALAAATSGDEIWVAAGTYKPTSDTDQTISFVMPTGVAIYGGFAGAETERNQRDWQTNESILSGDIGVEGRIYDNSTHVVVGSDSATLD